MIHVLTYSTKVLRGEFSQFSKNIVNLGKICDSASDLPWGKEPFIVLQKYPWKHKSFLP